MAAEKAGPIVDRVRDKVTRHRLKAFVAEAGFARRQLVIQIRDIGFNVVVDVGCGRDAKTFLDDSISYDLVVLEDRMPPGPSGLELLEKLRSVGFTAPVVFFASDPAATSMATLLSAVVIDKRSRDACTQLGDAVRSLFPGA